MINSSEMLKLKRTCRIRHVSNRLCVSCVSHRSTTRLT